MTLQAIKAVPASPEYLTIAFLMSGQPNPNNKWVESEKGSAGLIFDDSECLAIYLESVETTVSATVNRIAEDECVCDTTVRSAIARGKMFHEAGGL